MKDNIEIKEVSIERLNTENLQIRVEMNEECVKDYANIYAETPDEMPPVTVFYDFVEDAYFLADGFHRVAAAHLCGCDKIKAEVREGTYEDALRWALQANAKNGMRRTNADKCHALEIAWAMWDSLYKDMKRTTPDGRPSVRQLAAISGCSKSYAAIFIDKQMVSTVDTPSREEAIPSATKVTHEHLEERNPEVRAKLVEGLDRYGIAIPERLKPAFDSRLVRDLVRTIGRDIIKVIDTRMKNNDLCFIHSSDFAIRSLGAAIRALKDGEPWCVCRMCRGTGCGSCSNLGFQTKRQYGMNPSEYKAENV